VPDQAGGFDLLAVVGPTAAGKSGLAVELAERIGGEVLSADSMQLYRGMDIGTAKLPGHERRGIAHHLLDIWDVDEPADVARYAALAKETISEVRARGRIPVLVGGSGLYVSAVLDAYEFPGTDPALRARLEAELAASGPQAMHTRLAGSSPEAAAAILSTNGRRLVRALEILELTGSVRAVLPRPQLREGLVVLGVDTASPVSLDARIQARVTAMFDAGLVDEVDRLVAAGLRRGRTASRALGYRQVLDWRDGHLAGEAQARERTALATRRFARRQRSWFRRDPRVHWLRHDESTAGAALATVVPAALAALDAPHSGPAAG